MTSERQHFMDAIVASPNDDAPRLVYADWLEEQGDPRAEFIRLQVERHNNGDLADEDRIDREEALLIKNFSEWCPAIGAEGEVADCRFERGFVNYCEVQAGKFLKLGHALLDATPLDWIRLPYIKGKVEKLASEGLAARLAGLKIDKLMVPDKERPELFQSLERATRLDISGVKYDVDGKLAGWILDSPLEENLELLRVTDTRIEPSFFGAFKKRKLKKLRVLHFGSEMGGIRPAHFSPKLFPALEEIHVHHSARVVDMEQLCKLQPLKKYVLPAGIPHRGLKRMIESHSFEQAEELYFDLISEKNALELIRSSNLANCRVLQLGKAGLSSDFWAEFAEADLPRLKHLIASEGGAEAVKDRLPFCDSPVDSEVFYFNLMLGLLD